MKKTASNTRSDVANRFARDLIDSRRLFYFCHAARLGSFATAKALLDIAQPAMSRQIQQFEADLGVQLLERSGRGVSLTEVGSVLYRRAEAILTDMAETRAEVGLSKNRSLGQISIASPVLFIRAFMPRILCNFVTAYPDARLRALPLRRRQGE